jgi:hypothetical protein
MIESALSTVMPTPVAGIHAFPAVLQQAKAWMTGTSPAMTPERNGFRQTRLEDF